MARVIDIPPGPVEFRAENVDDGAGVFHNGTQVLHVHYLKSGSITHHLTNGVQLTVRLEVYNLTGGPYSATFKVLANGKSVYHAIPQGWTPPGWNVAWSDTFVIRATAGLQSFAILSEEAEETSAKYY